jgi:beta-amylase
LGSCEDIKSTQTINRSPFDSAIVFARAVEDGFFKEAEKPFVGAKQICSGESIPLPEPQTEHKRGYTIGSMAGQAFDFLVIQAVAKEVGLNPRATTIIASGALAALSPTQHGGVDLTERSKNFVVGAGSMAAFEGANAGLRKIGLQQGFWPGLVRETGSGALAGLTAAEMNSAIQQHKGATGEVAIYSMLGWAAAGGTFHVAGSGISRASSELMPELLARTGNLKPTLSASEAGSSAREFVVTSERNALDAFKADRAKGTAVTVREVVAGTSGAVKLGPRQGILVQHLSATEGDGRLLPAAKTTDIIATCHPENLSQAMRAKHVFSSQEGNVWLYTGKNNRILLTAGDQPINVTNINGYKEPFKLNRGDTTITVMAPLMVGDPNDIESKDSQAAMTDFRRMLKEAKDLKIDGVSIDFWWGLINKDQGKFDFSYYHKLTDEVIKSGLDFVPVMSFHNTKKGGNVGDNVDMPLPPWIWQDLADKLGSTDLDIGKYKSEQNHFSDEYIQLWADKAAMNYYADTISAFRSSFASKAPYISEVSMSLGPAGELRYPSYNSHDDNTGYPTRGALQAYSDLAKADFRHWTLQKYRSIQAVGDAWRIANLNANEILPPSNANDFFDRNDQANTQYGKDLIDWYNESLVKHADRGLATTQSILGAADSPLLGTPIGVKIPGIHWRMGWKNGDTVTFSDRKAEINAGLIQTSIPWDDAHAYGYLRILKMLVARQPMLGGGSPIVPSYTCLELPDGQDAWRDAQSLPHTAATRFGQAAQRVGLRLRGENALSESLTNGNDWDLMDSKVRTPLNPTGYYDDGLTLLRINNVVDNPVARAKVSALISDIHAKTNVEITTRPITRPQAKSS